ncbi:Heavy metal translocating P-type ATPase [Shewanella denitrificans OS217]|jgi:P-type Cu2+ transporter|uniref:P-type Cu(2+) transporter n=1 Tax=Shewanella denitrificans (strain OS217 / ATCC BAA-1090 / DSM 15013) TaxID=318161 RepID=Q12N46_SHEDO|nr:heavy metal translocating P-type ATPase metal-binding domain-containing protein [Shewanella denitrificans]ABE55130.1 Heavy metal translocating P-type ATPase [Shewanella denitrificans OS217]
MNRCFHCAEPFIQVPLYTQINGTAQPMCCPGCQAVSQAIMDAGLMSYYQYRSEPGMKQTGLVPEQLSHFSAYDLAEVQQDFVHQQDILSTTSLTITGMSCAACAWLIEHRLSPIEGIAKVLVNSTTQRAMISWDNSQVKLSEILTQISQIGYQAAPYQQDEQEKQHHKDSRTFLLRLGLAGFATMQVMMFALALYTGYFRDLDEAIRDYFRWVSMIFAAPVVLYSAQPFYFSALRSLLSGKLNMDVSVSIAIGGAFTASCVATINGTGEVYFESVSMFTFFLLLGRYFEQNARRRASISSNNLHKLVPLTALRLDGNQQTEIPAKSLRLGDIILVRPGDAFAADGVVIDGSSSANEAMLTGEQMPVDKNLDCPVFAGTLNVEQPLQVRVTALGQDQLVAEIIRLQEIAAANKPAIAFMVDKLARYFSATILTTALITYLVWLQISPDDAFWVTLSVLVATCPCALALATPTAVTCATAIFTRLGIITRKAGVFEKLASIEQVVFDKTGTLTRGHIALGALSIIDPQQNKGDVLTEKQMLAIAAALEAGSLHPIALAFSRHYDPNVIATEIAHFVAQGIEGKVQGQVYRIGVKAFVQGNMSLTASDSQTTDNTKPTPDTSPCVWLSQNGRLIASIPIQDEVRSDAKQAVEALQQANIQVCIASGDSLSHVNALGHTLGIHQVYAEQKPQDKLTLINQLQLSHNTAMFGDGINDAPVLAGAYLSVAMGSGSAIAKNSADLILLGDHLSRFNDAIKVAKKANAIIKQNLFWAFGYNLLILPLAVTGHVPPYIAALGMSLSSILVVSNSLRLLRIKL